MSRSNAQNQAYYIQYSGTPLQGHEDYIQSITSPDPLPNTNPPKPHINPNFRTKYAPNVHLNPKFHTAQHVGGVGTQRLDPPPVGLSTMSGVTRTQPLLLGSNPTTSPTKEENGGLRGGARVHVNPRFANRPLPSIPNHSQLQPAVQAQSQREPIYANVDRTVTTAGKVNLDLKRRDDFVHNIEQTVQAQVVMRNKYKKDNRTKPPEKPARLSIVERPKRFSVIEQPNRYSVVEKPKRNSIAITTPSVPAVVPPVNNAQTPVRKTEEKENLPSTSKKSFLFTPLRKTPFKKIGSRKLIRVKKKSLSPGTPKPSFKRIGNNKLIRIRETLSSENMQSPMKVYQLKTKNKIVKTVKNTPSNNSKYRFNFITPLSVKKNKTVNRSSGSKTSTPSTSKRSSFASRFRLDRRERKEKQLTKNSSRSRLKKLSGSTYHVSATKLQRITPVKPTRTRATHAYRPKAAVLNPNLAPNKLIMVQGVKFTVADNGRKLKRVVDNESRSLSYSASVSQTSPGQSQTTSPSTQTSPLGPSSPSKLKKSPSPAKFSPKQMKTKKTYIGGEEFDEVEPGVFTRSRHSLTRQSITQAKNRSINTILKVQNRSKQYCMFYNKFGKCTKKEKGSCPYIHDREKIAVCRRFLQGACTKDPCLLSHKLDPDKMPACKFFLEGVCTREACPYLHVKVSEKAGICQRFLKGFCPNGADCSQRHVIACPEFDRTGGCVKGASCMFPHVQRASTPATVVAAASGGMEPAKKKAVPPAKPKRKSLGGQASEHNLKKSRVTTVRYYDEQEPQPAEPDPEPNSDIRATAVSTDVDWEVKRKRILQKIDTVQREWRAGMTVDPEVSLNDSGPYETIDDASSVKQNALPIIGDKDRLSRGAPLGSLGDFISLTQYSSGDEDVKQDRLI